jgi:hypothetical protein
MLSLCCVSQERTPTVQRELTVHVLYVPSYDNLFNAWISKHEETNAQTHTVLMCILRPVDLLDTFKVFKCGAGEG